MEPMQPLTWPTLIPDAENDSATIARCKPSAALDRCEAAAGPQKPGTGKGVIHQSARRARHTQSLMDWAQE